LLLWLRGWLLKVSPSTNLVSPGLGYAQTLCSMPAGGATPPPKAQNTLFAAENIAPRWACRRLFSSRALASVMGLCPFCGGFSHPCWWGYTLLKKNLGTTLKVWACASFSSLVFCLCRSHYGCKGTPPQAFTRA